MEKHALHVSITGGGIGGLAGAAALQRQDIQVTQTGTGGDKDKAIRVEPHLPGYRVPGPTRQHAAPS